MKSQLTKEEVLKPIIKKLVTEQYVIKEEKLIVESIILSENVVDQFKQMLKRGAITATILSSLLASPTVSAADKAEIKNSYQQEMALNSTEKEVTVPTETTQVSVQQGESRFKAMQAIRKQAKQKAMEKLNLDPTKYEVKVKGINVKNEKSNRDQNSGDVSTSVSADVTVYVVKKPVVTQ